MTRKMIDADADDLLKRYAACRSVTEVARQFGVSAFIARKALTDAGATIIAAPLKREDVDRKRIVRMFKSGVGLRGIGDQLGLAPYTVKRCIEDAGLTPRNRSEQQHARMKRTPARARKRLAEAAHEAKRGKPNTQDALERAAKTRQQRQTHASEAEHWLADALRARGLVVETQVAVDRYNCDLTSGPVAVEIFGGGWHWHGRHLLISEDRFRRILDAGFYILVLAVDKRRHPLDASVADYVAAYIKERSRKPSRVREYRVVRGAGELLTSGSANDDQISIIPALRSARDARTGRYKSVPR